MWRLQSQFAGFWKGTLLRWLIDDLCDGGMTFKLIADCLKKEVPNREKNIVVTHMVNPKGIETLSANYDNVTFTNSYKDWENEDLPINVSVLKV
jgi:phosphoribosylpyrophosphate synthetase